MAIWDNIDKWGPGLFGAGVGLYSQSQEKKAAQERLRMENPELYAQLASGAQTNLSQAGSFDPRAFAADRFNAQQALVNPVYENQQNDMMRKLHAKGLLGVANFNPGIEGVTPSGVAMNPHMAALFAAQNAQRSKDAYSSMGEGQKYLDSILGRATNLAGAAKPTQSLTAARTASVNSKNSLLPVLQGGLKIANEYGLFGKAADWLSGIGGGGNNWTTDYDWAGNAGVGTDFGW